MFNQIACEVPHAFNGLNDLLFGGEAVDPHWVRQVLSYDAPRRLLHVYGPTENTTFSTWQQVKTVLDEASTVPIGCPIANSICYVLDAGLEPVPIGVVGELYVAGAGLARGYLNRPGLTAERFAADPHGEPGTRMYRTGDLARWRADGSLEFLGRADQQVKLRGFRIEPGEIEAVLSAVPGVAQAAVIAREDGPGGKQLVAYVVAAPGEAPEAATLRRELGQRLPDYMVPSAFVMLEALPLTPNGKLDRLSLPVPNQTSRTFGSSFVAPRDELELKLRKIWEDVLGTRPISVRDNFFDLGGHSLLATRVIATIEKVFRKRLPLVAIFNAQTIEQLAKILCSDLLLSSAVADQHSSLEQKGQESRNSSSLVVIQSEGVEKPVFLIASGMEGEAGLAPFARIASLMKLKRPIYGMRPQLDRTQKLHPSVHAMAADYIDEMRIHQPEGPYYLVGDCIGGIVAFEMAQQLHARGNEVGALVLLDTMLGNAQKWYETSRPRVTILERLQIARFVYHLRRLRQLGFRQSVNYIVDRYRMIYPRIRSGRSPVTVRDVAYDNRVSNYVSIIACYAPQPYPKRLTLLLSEGTYKEHDISGWKHLALGGLEIHRVPGNHDSYLREHSLTTAAQLRDCLDGAQTRE